MFHETFTTPRPRPPNSRNRSSSTRRIFRQRSSSSTTTGLSNELGPAPEVSPHAQEEDESERVERPARKSISPPPPPYLSTLDSPQPSIESSAPIPLGVVTVSKEEDSTRTTEEWVKARSREELDRLLLEADRVIRERERELELAASIGKSLLENNIALRNRHESLLASLPETTPVTNQTRTRPSFKPASSWITDDGVDESDENPFGTTSRGSCTPIQSHFKHTGLISTRPSSVEPEEELFRSFERFDGRPSASPSTTYGAGPSSSARSKRVVSVVREAVGSSPTSTTFSDTSFGGRSHGRRQSSLSASPQALAFLREQNHELALQLEALQEETEDADHAGKKKLRKLEKEIGSLRAALENTEAIVDTLREQNQTLEQQVERRTVQEGLSLKDGGWTERRRARIEREMEERTVNGNVEDSPCALLNKQFIRESTLLSTSSSPLLAKEPHRSLSDDPDSPTTTTTTATSSSPASPHSRSLSLLGPSLSAASSPRTSSYSKSTRSEAEMALVSQLLTKIEELERANEDIRRKRDEMDFKLDRAKKEGEELKGVYDILESEVEKAGLEVVDLEESNQPPARGPEKSGKRSPWGGSPSWSGFHHRNRQQHPSPTTSGKSPNSSNLEVKFFGSSPVSSPVRLPSPEALSPSPSTRPEASQTPLGDCAPTLLFPTSPASLGASSPSRFGTGNRLQIERKRRIRATSSFISPTSARSSPRSASQENYSASITPSPEILQELKAGSPLKLRIHYTTEETEGHHPVRRMTLEDEFGEIEEGLHSFSLRSSLLNRSPSDGGPNRSAKFRPNELLEETFKPSTTPNDHSDDDEQPPTSTDGCEHDLSRSDLDLSEEESSQRGALTVRVESVELALQRGSDDLYDGRSLDTSTPILSLGSLTQLPSAEDSETFAMLDQMVAERTVRWSDEPPRSTNEMALAPDPMSVATALWSLLPSLLPQDIPDPFESTPYPEPPERDEEEIVAVRRLIREEKMEAARLAGLDPYSWDVLRAPTKRELALYRMRERRGMRSEGEEDSDEADRLVDGERRGSLLVSAPSDGISSSSTRMMPWRVMDQIGKKWVNTLMDLWFLCQIIVIAVVFINEMVRNGRKILRAIDERQYNRRPA